MSIIRAWLQRRKMARKKRQHREEWAVIMQRLSDAETVRYSDNPAKYVGTTKIVNVEPERFPWRWE